MEIGIVVQHHRFILAAVPGLKQILNVQVPEHLLPAVPAAVPERVQTLKMHGVLARAHLIRVVLVQVRDHARHRV